MNANLETTPLHRFCQSMSVRLFSMKSDVRPAERVWRLELQAENSRSFQAVQRRKHPCYGRCSRWQSRCHRTNGTAQNRRPAFPSKSRSYYRTCLDNTDRAAPLSRCATQGSDLRTSSWSAMQGTTIFADLPGYARSPAAEGPVRVHERRKRLQTSTRTWSCHR